jgi:hypothetical protein
MLNTSSLVSPTSGYALLDFSRAEISDTAAKKNRFKAKTASEGIQCLSWEIGTAEVMYRLASI